MTSWPSSKARQVLSALYRIGWTLKRQSGSHEYQQVGSWPVAVVEDTSTGARATIALLHQFWTAKSCATVGIQFIEPPDAWPVRPVAWEGETERFSPVPVRLLAPAGHGMMYCHTKETRHE